MGETICIEREGDYTSWVRANEAISPRELIETFKIPAASTNLSLPGTAGS